MWAAISYLLLAFGLLEEARASGFKPDWPKTLTLTVWIIVFTAAACGVLLWGLQEKRELWGLAGFAAMEAAGIAIALLIARRWISREKATQTG